MRRDLRERVTSADLLGVFLILLLIASLLLSSRACNSIPGFGAPSEAVSDVTVNATVTTSIVGTFDDALAVSTLPTPGPADAEMTEETTSIQDDSNYVISGVIRNLNAFWTLEITELPTVQVIDTKNTVVETRPIQVASTLIPPRSEVTWSFTAPATPGRPAAAFNRSDLKARWLHPDQDLTPSPQP